MVYDYEYFKKEVYKLTQIDLNAYKEKLGDDEETKTKIFNAVRKQQEKEVERMLKMSKPDVSDDIIKFALQEIKTKIILKEKVIKEEDESDKIIHFNDYRNR